MVTSPIEFYNKSGNLEKAYKFDVINELLKIQKSIHTISNKFILFLTVHCSYNEEEINIFINNPPTEDIKNYISKYKKLKSYKKNSRIVRLFVAHYLRQKFEAFGFTSKILPSLFYKGIGNNYLLHFSVLGINSSATVAGNVALFQTFTDIINQKFVSIDNSEFINKSDNFEEEKDVVLDPVKLFTESKTFQKLWQ